MVQAIQENKNKNCSAESNLSWNGNITETQKKEIENKGKFPALCGQYEGRLH